jgi:hypothetical protein
MVARFVPLDPNDRAQVPGYPLRARLGSGGMGNVYLSFTPGGRAVAIKVMRQEFADDLVAATLAYYDMAPLQSTRTRAPAARGTASRPLSPETAVPPVAPVTVPPDPRPLARRRWPVRAVVGALVAAAVGAGVVVALTAGHPGGPPTGSANTTSGGYAAEYRHAITRRPMSATVVRFSQLRPGTQFCLIPGVSVDQLVLLTLVSKSSSAYDLTWAATAWTILAMTK